MKYIFSEFCSMALRQRTLDEIVNQENVTSRFAAKSALVEQAKIVPKRAALGELGNKLPAFQKTAVPLKKNGTLAPTQATRPANGHTLAQAKPKQTMPPPQAAAKKTTTAPLPFKETKKIPDKIVSVAAKPGVKRQESILKNIMDEGKTSSRETLKSYSAKQLAIIDPDEGSKNEPAMVTEYLEDIFNYLRSMETKFPIREDFLEGHETTVRMRAILVNWLVEVHMNFKLYLETLHLCVAIVDRYLQKNKHVGRNSLQLVGTSAMLVASKYEEMYIPDLKDFVYICDNTFSERQILTMERDILKKLDFSLGRPLSVHFLRRYNKIAQARSDHHTLGKFMLELSLLEYEMSSVNPSLQAAAACCLSMGILNDVMELPKLWTPTLVHYTNYEYSEFKDVIVSLANILVKSESSKYQTIRKKYASSSYSKISLNPKLQGVLVKKLATVKIPIKK
ncbi:cyclin B isoform X1 [Leptinotarsa decemlineata]|uniref:cyclin B isoform X1 n=2 Tax=Leptinotarsa decemlineata TaxID=7539 RepID=UPI003D306186